MTIYIHLSTMQEGFVYFFSNRGLLSEILFPSRRQVRGANLQKGAPSCRSGVNNYHYSSLSESISTNETYCGEKMKNNGPPRSVTEAKCESRDAARLLPAVSLPASKEMV